PVRISLGLLPSGPDPVGEEHVRANLPTRYMRIIGSGCKGGRSEDAALAQPLQPSLAPDYILVVPLHGPCFGQPEVDGVFVDLVAGRIALLGRLEASFGNETGCLEGLAAPEQ